MSIGVVAIALAAVAIGISVTRSLLTRPRKRQHPYFHRLWVHAPGEYTRWEAELDWPLTGPTKALGIHSAEAPDGLEEDEIPPTESEVQFCRDLLADVPGIIGRCAPLLEREGASVAECQLEGFSVPKNGNRFAKWSVMLWHPGTGCSYSFQIDGESVTLETVER